RRSIFNSARFGEDEVVRRSIEIGKPIVHIEHGRSIFIPHAEVQGESRTGVPVVLRESAVIVHARAEVKRRAYAAAHRISKKEIGKRVSAGARGWIVRIHSGVAERALGGTALAQVELRPPMVEA